MGEALGQAADKTANFRSEGLAVHPWSSASREPSAATVSLPWRNPFAVAVIYPQRCESQRHIFLVLKALFESELPSQSG